MAAGPTTSHHQRNRPPRFTMVRAACLTLCVAAITPTLTHPSKAEEASPRLVPMQGVPPSRETQVTLANYAQYPLSRWSFRNPGAVFNTVSIPRQGAIHVLPGPARPELGQQLVTDAQGQAVGFNELFKANYANGVAIVQGEKLLHEAYFHDFSPLDRHLWFSMTKSLVSSAFGILIAQGKVNLQASPADYIPELKGTGFERVSIQQVLDHSTALDFKEDYVDPQSDFARHYLPALSMGWLPGAADVQPADATIYGVHDFLMHFVNPRADLEPGMYFNYNSSNADVLGWLISRVSGVSLHTFLQKELWSKLGAEHDALMVVDRALMPVATAGMSSTLRDAARFGMMIRDRGEFAGQRVIPADWVDATLSVKDSVRSRMANHPSYQQEPWFAYHNMWWVLSVDQGEYCALGSFGQIIYVNRSANTVIVWFSSQPLGSAVSNAPFRAKLKAARTLAATLHEERCKVDRGENCE
ncbi:MAG: serine hydrolase [Pseudomonadota bacterium]